MGVPSKGFSASAWKLVSQFPVARGEAEQITKVGPFEAS